MCHLKKAINLRQDGRKTLYVWCLCNLNPRTYVNMCRFFSDNGEDNTNPTAIICCIKTLCSKYLKIFHFITASAVAGSDDGDG